MLRTSGILDETYQDIEDYNMVDEEQKIADVCRYRKIKRSFDTDYNNFETL